MTRLTALGRLAQIRTKQGLPADPALLPNWTFKLLGLTITLPNFSWRKDAINKHDLHHLALAQPFSLAGECQVATWEFASGPHPDLRAQAFCLPLVALGALTAPRATWESYKLGRGQQSLYQTVVDETLSLNEVRNLIGSGQNHHTDVRLGYVRLGYVRLVAASIFLWVCPVAFGLTTAIVWL